ncbi:MAG TPA: thioredoxin family protein [Thermoanaerobaculia bacterium]|nr:thioredoxin family protein [Thermoanaerobaculia bacterium]
MRLARFFLVTAVLVALCSAASAASPEIGSPAPAFDLTTLEGKSVSLADATKSHKAVVVIFIATKCPYSNAYNVRMRDLAAAYEKQGVMFLGINSNNTEPEAEVRSHAREHGLAFPIAKDPGNKVADLYDAKRTPEVFVVTPDGKLRYHGRIDENSEDASQVKSPDLKNALDALLAGRTLEKAETKAFGCTIKRA